MHSTNSTNLLKYSVVAKCNRGEMRKKKFRKIETTINILIDVYR